TESDDPSSRCNRRTLRVRTDGVRLGTAGGVSLVRSGSFSIAFSCRWQQNRFCHAGSRNYLSRGELDSYVPCCGLIAGEEDRVFEVQPLEPFEQMSTVNSAGHSF